MPVDKLRLKRPDLGPAVVAAAGLGTRLLPLTKEIPKEMLPVFYIGKNNRINAKPLLQLIFDQLFEFGFNNFQFVINKGKRIIERHFTADINIIDSLIEKGRVDDSEEINSFFKRLDLSSINYVNQSRPLGFGDAVLKTESFIDEPFLVQAGDNYFHSNDNQHLMKLISSFHENKSKATFLVKEVKDPENFGVIEGKEFVRGLYRVENVFEKPIIPNSNLAIVGLYYFHPEIFRSLKLINNGVNNELQLTDGIQKLIDSGHNVTAVKLDNNDQWFDVGNINSYWNTLMETQTQLMEYERRIFDWGENLLKLL
jgi:UTP--glucose-1-phosphate uridylyltransferase